MKVLCNEISRYFILKDGADDIKPAARLKTFSN